jgi:hypothetical protein
MNARDIKICHEVLLRCPQIAKDREWIVGPDERDNPIRLVDLTDTLAELIAWQLDARAHPWIVGFDLNGRTYACPSSRGEADLRRRGAQVVWSPLTVSAVGRIGPWARRAYEYWWRCAVAAASEQLAEYGLLVTAEETLDWRDWWDAPYAQTLKAQDPTDGGRLVAANS